MSVHTRMCPIKSIDLITIIFCIASEHSIHLHSSRSYLRAHSLFIASRHSTIFLLISFFSATHSREHSFLQRILYKVSSVGSAFGLVLTLLLAKQHSYCQFLTYPNANTPQCIRIESFQQKLQPISTNANSFPVYRKFSILIFNQKRRKRAIVTDKVVLTKEFGWKFTVNDDIHKR